MNDRLLTIFRIGESRFALDTASIREISSPGQVTPVPRAAPWIAGLTFFRGSIVTVLDTGLRLGLTGAVRTGGKMIILELFSGQAALLADSIVGMVPENRFTPESVAGDFGGNAAKFIRSFYRSGDGTIIGELDLSRLFTADNTIHTPGSPIPAAALQPREPGDREAEARQVTACLSVMISGEEYGFLLSSVREVIRTPDLTPVPEPGPYVTGILSVRGSILPVADLRQILGLPAPADTENGESREKSIVILHSSGVTAGILVDRLGSIVRVPGNVSGLSGALRNSTGDRYHGIARLDGGKRLIFVLNEARLLPEHAGTTGSRQEEKEEQSVAEIPAEKGRRVLVFRIGAIGFCIPIDVVLEVGRREQLSAVPKAPPFLAGMLSFHGLPVPVLDLGRLFHLATSPDSDRGGGSIIFVKLNELTAGLSVDSVTEVRIIPSDRILPAPATLTAELDVNFIQGICQLPDPGSFLLLIDTEKILSHEEKKVFRKKAGQQSA